MGLVAAALLLVAGCYDPSLKDCTVSCAADSDCASGQACATGGWCAAAGQSCSGIDAATARDASVADAHAVDAAPPDAMTNATLRVTIMNHGEVVIPGIGTCNEDMPGAGGPAMMTTCDFPVVSGNQVTATATATVTAAGHPFDKWTDPLCKSQGASCTFTVLPFTVIQAQFK